MNWSLALARPITLKDGRVLRTLDDASEWLASLSESHQFLGWNQYAAELLFKAAKSGERDDIEYATAQMRRALSREGAL